MSKISCPHCGVPFPPRWKATPFNALNPSREAEETIGSVWATTCMSCDKPIVEFEPRKKDGPLGDIGRIPLFPVSKEQSINIVIEIILNFRNLQSRGKGEPEMTVEEREAEAGTLREKLNGMKEAVVKGMYMRATQGIGLFADTAQIAQVISDIVK